MSIYDTLLSNKEYLKLVDRIEQIQFITDGKWDWEHGLGHYKRVADYVNKILIQLKADERTIDLGMSAALLHDIGLSESGTQKVDHGIKSSKMFRNYIHNTDVTKEEEKILEHAIADHSKGDNIDSLIGLALVLADKLDVTYHRTENSSIQDKMNKEIQKIRAVDIEINDKELIVKYYTTDKLDIKILRGWEKALTIPEKIASYLNKKYTFIVNNEKENAHHVY